MSSIEENCCKIHGHVTSHSNRPDLFGISKFQFSFTKVFKKYEDDSNPRYVHNVEIAEIYSHTHTHLLGKNFVKPTFTEEITKELI